MQNRKSWLAAATVSLVTLAAGILGAQTFEQSVNNAVSKDGTLLMQTTQLKASVDQHAAEEQKAVQDYNDQQAQMDDAAFHGGGPGRGGPGRGGPGGHPGPGPRPGPRPGPHPGPVGPGRGGWGRWGGHPGWGYGHRWGWIGGRYIWWGWAAWSIGSGLACNGYYSGAYSQCSNAAWADNAACKSSCASNGFPEPSDCSYQCDSETRNAINSCEYSYRSYWNCPYAVVWPPVGIVIRIP